MGLYARTGQCTLEAQVESDGRWITITGDALSFTVPIIEEENV